MSSTAPSPPPARSDAAATLPGIEAHAHALAVLVPALPPVGSPSHAYLFHGPAGTGKRAIARAFAAALLADGARDRQTVADRVARGCHPDLTWVRPSGAAEVLVSDIDEPVVAAAMRTPFESARRVFVIEAVDTMNDQAANRMLKTLEGTSRLRAPDPAQRPSRGRAGDDRLALPAGALRSSATCRHRPTSAGRAGRGSCARRRAGVCVRAPGAGRRELGRALGRRAGRRAARRRRAARALRSVRCHRRASLDGHARRGQGSRSERRAGGR